MVLLQVAEQVVRVVRGKMVAPAIRPRGDRVLAVAAAMVDLPRLEVRA
jgi:hypothetical protein